MRYFIILAESEDYETINQSLFSRLRITYRGPRNVIVGYESNDCKAKMYNIDKRFYDLYYEEIFEPRPPLLWRLKEKIKDRIKRILR